MKELRYSKLTIKEMFVLHNEHAAKIGVAPMRPRPKDRVEMAKALALILTHRPPMPFLVRDVAIEELCKVSHKDEGGVAVGFPYAEVVKAVKIRLPNSNITKNLLFVYSSSIRMRKKGFRHAKLPPKRSRLTKETSK